MCVETGFSFQAHLFSCQAGNFDLKRILLATWLLIGNQVARNVDLWLVRCYACQTMALILNGRALGKRIQDNVKARVAELALKPGLAVILVGNDPASHTYVNIKARACLEAGIHFEEFLYEANSAQEVLENKIQELNQREDIHGILVQLPLPSQNADHLIAVINPNKDVDGFHPKNIRALKEGKPALVSAVALGIVRLIAVAMKQGLQPRTATIISSALFAEPIIELLRERSISSTVEVIEKNQESAKIFNSDIIIIALGHPNFLKGNMIKPGSIIIDVGTTKINGLLHGDVDRASVEFIAGALSPVPGGVGPMTVAMLLLNVLKAFQLQHVGRTFHQQESRRD